MPRKYNVKKDQYDSRDHIALRATKVPQTSVSLLSSLGPVRDQGDTSSCTAQSGAGFLDFLYMIMHKYFKTKVSGDVEFSALCLYALSRIMDGSFPSDDGLSDSRTVMKTLNQKGTCLNVMDPFADAKVSDAPTDAMLEEAGNFRIGAYHRVLFDEGCATSKSVLVSGYCHIIGIPVYKELESDEVAETGLLPIPSRRSTPISGHEMLVYGFDDSIKIHSSIGAHEVRNSWNSDWGLNGNLRIPYEYYAAVGGNENCDAWVGHMGKPWVKQ